VELLAFAQIDASALPGPCPGAVGLTTALVELRSGWVIVGSLPTIDGSAATAQAGCLLVLDSNGNVVETIANSNINGPWDMAVFDETGRKGMPGRAILFVNNVLNGTVAAGGNVVNQGTTLRIVLQVPPSGIPSVTTMTLIGSGFSERTDPAALVIGATGLALSKNNNTLYVADSLNNRIAAISNPLTRSSTAGTGSPLSRGGALNDPLGITLAVNENILAANGNDGNLVKTTPRGDQISVATLDDSSVPGSLPGAGTLFGFTDIPAVGVVFVDDGSNTLNRFR
jgi:DNA-binding beta-propeller fold protein YncE